MPSGKQQVKQETRVPKIGTARKRCNGRLKETELSTHGRVKHIADASLVCIPCDSQSRRDSTPSTTGRSVWC